MYQRNEIKTIIIITAFIISFFGYNVAYATSDNEQDNSNVNGSQEVASVNITSPLNGTQYEVGDIIEIEGTAVNCENVALFIDNQKVEGVNKNGNCYSYSYILSSTGTHKIQFRENENQTGADPSYIPAFNEIVITVCGISNVTCNNDMPYRGTDFHFTANIYNTNEIEKAVVAFKRADGTWPLYEDIENNDKFVMSKEKSSSDYLYEKDINITNCGTSYYKIIAKDKYKNILETPEYEVRVNDIIKDNWKINYNSKKKTVDIMVSPKAAYQNWEGMPHYGLAVWKAKSNGSKAVIYKGTEKKMKFKSESSNDQYHKTWYIKKSSLNLKQGQTYIFKIVSYYSKAKNTLLSEPRKIKIDKATRLSDNKISKQLESGKEVIWDGCTQKLLYAKDKFVKLIKAKGWRIKFNSAYRPVCYQKHLYYLNCRVKRGKATRSEMADYRRHGLCGLVAKPSCNAPHCKGVAFDAVIYNTVGHALNGERYMNSKVRTLAKKAGLFTIYHDNVHFQIR